MKPLRCEVLVIGSGAGGALTAAMLAEAGRDVLLVEEGLAVDRPIATHSPEAMQLWFRNSGLTPLLGDVKIALVEGRCLGGGTEVNSAFWHRPFPQILDRWREEFRIEELSEAALAPLFEELERELNVRTLGDTPPPRSSALLATGLERMGWAYREVPRAVSHDPGANQYFPGAKRSMSQTYLPRARRAGARLHSPCRIERLTVEGRRVTGARGRSFENGAPEPVEIVADHVFVCGGATQTPALLRRSGIKKNVGDSLKIHPMLKVAAEFPEVLDSHLAALPVYQASEFWPDITIGGAVYSAGYLAMILSEDWAERQREMVGWHRMALYYTACCGTGKGRVRAFPFTGEALAFYSLSSRDQQLLTEGFRATCQALFAAGATHLYPALRHVARLDTPAQVEELTAKPLPLNTLSLSTVHAFSSCPLGEDRSRCAADSYGRVHDYANLFLNDASLLPDSPGVNPQGTIMGLALRNVRHFLQSPPAQAE